MAGEYASLDKPLPGYTAGKMQTHTFKKSLVRKQQGYIATEKFISYICSLTS